MPFTATPISAQRLRITGYIVLAAFFFFFFMLEMAFSWRVEHLYLKIIFLTLVHTLLMWEPTRILILYLRKRFVGPHQIRPRIRLLAAIAFPYAFMLGFLRIYFEDRSNLWGVPIASWSSYSYTIGITLLFILLQIAVYESLNFFWEWNRATTEAAEVKRINVQTQMDLLKVQIQPHFLFNALNTLIGLIETDEKQAVSFTQRLAFNYRHLLQVNEKLLISLGDELRFVKTYVELLRTRYADGLIIVTDFHQPEGFEVPPFCLQLLVENAIKHNTITTERPLEILMYLDQQNRKVFVQNNYQPKTNVQKTGEGLRQLQERFKLLELPPVTICKTAEHFIVDFPVIKTKVL